MRHLIFIFVLLVSVGCHAEPRWCTVTGLGSGQSLRYVPLAQWARVSGVVISRVTYLPDGTVQAVEPIFGPAMLSEGLTLQAKNWTIKTNVTGGEPCVSLLVAKFTLSGGCNAGPAGGAVEAIDTSQPSTLKLAVDAAPLCTTDLAPDPTGRRGDRRNGRRGPANAAIR